MAASLDRLQNLELQIGSSFRNKGQRMRELNNEGERLMRLTGFETLAEYLKWIDGPMTEEVLAKPEDGELEEELIESGRWDQAEEIGRSSL